MTAFTISTSLSPDDVEERTRHVPHPALLWQLVNARYEFLKPALEEVGSELALGHLLARIDASFTAVVPDAEIDLDIELTISAIGRTSFTTSETITRDGTVVLRGTAVLVATGEEGPRPLTDAERSWLSRYAVDA